MGRENIPTYKDMMGPTISALKNLGGKASVTQIYNEVVEIMELDNKVLKELHESQGGYKTEVEYRLAWARTYLKKYGLIDNSQWGVWELTDLGHEIDTIDSTEIIRHWSKKIYEENK